MVADHLPEATPPVAPPAPVSIFSAGPHFGPSLAPVNLANPLPCSLPAGKISTPTLSTLSSRNLPTPYAELW
ncbi:hypothetical protein CGLO_09005 [Colletotrichum gloeosporioides Cg-14]|uniref:Uncharacterized protein n=1 Tax=Colletotrichum gloeosporioides (strain Cg-14) TaxID=1237896 RepID=T0LTB2_COLGC|nr:hypothetical protein CGLO_09005 [Colletotrichum gloeosporioides Cg-14]